MTEESSKVSTGETSIQTESGGTSIGSVSSFVVTQPAKSSKKWVVIAILIVVLVLVGVGAVYLLKFAQKVKTIDDTIKNPPTVDTLQNEKLAKVFDPQLLKLVLGDEELAEATLELIAKSQREGRNLLTEEGVAVFLMMLPGQRDSISMTILGKANPNAANAIKGGFFHKSLPDPIYQRVEDSSDLISRNVDFQAFDPKQAKTIEDVYYSAYQGDMAPTMKYLEQPRKIGLILASPKQVVKGEMGNDIETLAGSGVATLDGPSSFTVRAICTDEAACQRVTDFAESVKALALVKLRVGAQRNDTVKNIFEQVNDLNIEPKGRVFQAKGLVHELLVKKGLRKVPVLFKRVTRASKGLPPRDPNEVRESKEAKASDIKKMEQFGKEDAKANQGGGTPAPTPTPAP